MLREPVARARSAYEMFRSWEDRGLPITKLTKQITLLQLVRREEKTPWHPLHRRCDRWHILCRGYYAAMMRTFAKGAEAAGAPADKRVPIILISERVRLNPLAEYNNLLRRVGFPLLAALPAEAGKGIGFTRTGNYNSTLDSSTACILARHYAEDQRLFLREHGPVPEWEHMAAQAVCNVREACCSGGRAGRPGEQISFENI